MKKERPYERIGLTFVILINPSEKFEEDETFTKSSHLSTTIIDENGQNKEFGIRISLGELYQEGNIILRITKALEDLGKDKEYIKLYLELIEKNITKDKIF